MRKLYSFLSILILTALLAGCAASANAHSNEAKVAGERVSTSLPEKPMPTDSAIAEIVPDEPPASCPITIPQNPPFIPPAPYDSLGFEGNFWYGTNALWTAVRQDGVWRGLPHNRTGYTQKVFWWSEGYVWNEEPEPNLIVTGERLDAPAPPLIVSKATNAYAGDIGSAILVGVDFPMLGCWKITGTYADAERSFVVWVAP